VVFRIPLCSAQDFLAAFPAPRLIFPLQEPFICHELRPGEAALCSYPPKSHGVSTSATGCSAESNMVWGFRSAQMLLLAASGLRGHGSRGPRAATCHGGFRRRTSARPLAQFSQRPGGSAKSAVIERGMSTRCLRLSPPIGVLGKHSRQPSRATGTAMTILPRFGGWGFGNRADVVSDPRRRPQAPP